MWCHTLLLLRELVHGDIECVRQVLTFVARFDVRLYSALLVFDPAQQYQQLKQFTNATGLAFSQLIRQNFQPGLLYLFELNATLFLFAEVLSSPDLKANFP
jgi:hypothetical protein